MSDKNPVSTTNATYVEPSSKFFAVVAEDATKTLRPKYGDMYGFHPAASVATASMGSRAIACVRVRRWCRGDPHDQLAHRRPRGGSRTDHGLDGRLRVRLHGGHRGHRDHRANRGDAGNAGADRRRPGRGIVLARSPLDAVGQAGDRRAGRRRTLRTAHSGARRTPPAGALPVRPTRQVLRHVDNLSASAPLPEGFDFLFPGKSAA